MSQKTPHNTELIRREEGGMTPWRPWNQFAELHRQMDNLLGHAFDYTPLARLIPSSMEAWEPDVDIYQTDDKVQVFAALPGYAPDQINVEATNDTIQIWGERKPFMEDTKAVPHRRGWQSGFSQFSCSYSLPAEIDPNSVKATFHNGILQMEMNKTEQSRTKAVKVNVQKS